MTRRSIGIFAIALLLSQASAQSGDGFVGTSKSILNSSLCTQIAVCKATGSAVVMGAKRSFYNVTLRQRVAYGLNTYDLYVTTRNGVAESVTLLYPPAQDGFGDGKFRLAFFTAATGVSFKGQPAAIEYSCEMRLRGTKSNYYITDDSMSLFYARQQLTTVMSISKDDSQMFSDIPKSRIVTFSTNC
ncbi:MULTISPECIES: hypothetical protein [unclassified Deinococcus]|uniref:hypothetical protein n=1 Tax=unclassified Deinococcus TaxID=2623546 RepID=UPI001C302928|nr:MULTISPECIES: hypothetical protein [unclassified Deinococcus]MDK2010987.1 hypothetical protein [Deinococcus sp. 43]